MYNIITNLDSNTHDYTNLFSFFQKEINDSSVPYSSDLDFNLRVNNAYALNSDESEFRYMLSLFYTEKGLQFGTDLITMAIFNKYESPIIRIRYPEYKIKKVKENSKPFYAIKTLIRNRKTLRPMEIKNNLFIIIDALLVERWRRDHDIKQKHFI